MTDEKRRSLGKEGSGQGETDGGNETKKGMRKDEMRREEGSGEKRRRLRDERKGCGRERESKKGSGRGERMREGGKQREKEEGKVQTPHLRK